MPSGGLKGDASDSISSLASKGVKALATNTPDPWVEYKEADNHFLAPRRRVYPALTSHYPNIAFLLPSQGVNEILGGTLEVN
ncbi:hypothetical protein AVEN_100566-1 [Araneus ventricosus]|uniref:Uncharacterized protein n=1 Tax=Araneus ventricosus TaxID=182803 RepID=A0A4Y2FF16_ARAVE|nr:hypothetical protein AVEN_100566-1 [Araneus ventricosus]